MLKGENAGNVEELDTTAELVAPNKPNKRRSRNFKKGVEIAKKGVEIAAPKVYCQFQSKWQFRPLKLQFSLRKSQI